MPVSKPNASAITALVILTMTGPYLSNFELRVGFFLELDFLHSMLDEIRMFHGFISGFTSLLPSIINVFITIHAEKLNRGI